jgi:hypothetical protein
VSAQPLYKKLGCEDAATFWTACPHCGKLQGKHASLQPLRAPEDGDASFCSNCGNWAIYQNDALGRLRLPTAEEEAELADDEFAERIVLAWGDGR